MIRTILVFCYLIIGMLILFPFALLSLIISLPGLRKPMSYFTYRLAQGWAKAVISATGCKVKVAGRDKIPKKGGVCFVSNHCGFFDIALLLAYCGRPFGFIAKRELIYIPFVNAWIFMLGGLFIDRKNVRKAIRTINKGVERIKRGGGMIIFPEGTRSKGRGLLPFHQGSLKLATQANSTIVPVAIEGSYDVYEKNYRIVTAPARITFLESIDTSSIGLEDRKHVLCDRVYSAIKEELGI